MILPQWVAIGVYAVLVAVAATWPNRKAVAIGYPVGTALSFGVGGLFAAWLAGLATSSVTTRSLFGIGGLAMFPLLAYFLLSTTPATEWDGSSQNSSIRVVAWGLAILPAVVLVF